MKYAVKDAEKLKNFASIACNSLYQTSNLHTITSEANKGIRIMHAMLENLTNVFEYGSVMMSLLIIQDMKCPIYTGVPFERVSLYDAIALLSPALDYKESFGKGGERFIHLWEAYGYRPKWAMVITLQTFVRKFEMIAVKNIAQIPPEFRYSINSKSMLSDKHHPYYTKFAFSFRKTRIDPFFQQPTLPPLTELNQNHATYKTDLHYITILIKFGFWHGKLSKQMFKGGISWKSKYEYFLNRIGLNYDPLHQPNENGFFSNDTTYSDFHANDLKKTENENFSNDTTYSDFHANDLKKTSNKPSEPSLQNLCINQTCTYCYSMSTPPHTTIKDQSTVEQILEIKSQFLDYCNALIDLEERECPQPFGEKELRELVSEGELERKEFNPDFVFGNANEEYETIDNFFDHALEPDRISTVNSTKKNMINDPYLNYTLRQIPAVDFITEITNSYNKETKTNLSFATIKMVYDSLEATISPILDSLEDFPTIELPHSLDVDIDIPMQQRFL
jgi:hypothetical protein